jgi:6,7-dimethyl-8-ribityllumazine synthase
LSLIGLVAFDLSSIRIGGKGVFDWRQFLRLERLDALAALGSVVAGSIAVATISYVQGQLSAALLQLVQAVSPVVPVFPPK